MKQLFNKLRSINETGFLGLAILIVLGFFLFTNNKSLSSSTKALISEPSSQSTLPTPPQKVVWLGKVHWHMTYGRRLFENLTPNSEYKYFIGDPLDEVEDGALRYSPMTESIKDDEIVKVTGVIEENCSWNFGVDDTDYKGCVPWVFIGSIDH